MATDNPTPTWTPPEFRERWLDLHREEAIDPALPIIDAHHHLWDAPQSRYLLPDLLSDVQGGHNVVGTVYIEAKSMLRADGPAEMKPVGEVEFANGVAAMSASGAYGAVRTCAAIVGHADMLLGAAVEPVLAALVRAGGGRLRGVRHILARDPELRLIAPERLAADSRFREAFALLARHQLSFDVWMYHPQLHELAPLLAAFPETPVILDHLGGLVGVGSYAANAADNWSNWRRSLRELARFPNLTIKLGGFGMPMFGHAFQERPKPPSSDDIARAAGPAIETAIEIFGADRCMFESNFPVDKTAFSYVALWNAFKKIASGASNAEKHNLFSGVAARVYRLDLPQPAAE